MEVETELNNIRMLDVTIGKYMFHVNSEVDDLLQLNSFRDAIPKYNNINGPHLELKPKNSSEPTESSRIVCLNNYTCSRLLIKGAQNMSDEEYFMTFVEEKAAFVEKYLLASTFGKGFEIPSVVQSFAIPYLIQGKDTLVQFKAGTGKSWAFLFGLLWSFDPNNTNLQFVFITSSHEVAVQLYKQAVAMVPNDSQVVLCIGQKKTSDPSSGGFKTVVGTRDINRHRNIKNAIEEIGKAQIIVATMGKFYDCLCNRKWIQLNHLKAMCVDEFDNIIVSQQRSRSSSTMSTEEQILRIWQDLPKNTQRVFFSATLSDEGRALNVAYNYFRPVNADIGKPLLVILNNEDYMLDTIRQYYVKCSTSEVKREVIMDLLNRCRLTQGIVFVNTIQTATLLKEYLKKKINLMEIEIFHGELLETERQTIHQKFEKNELRLLVSTDVISRGFDAQNLNLVINYDMPVSLVTYIHRVGRAGRYGRYGIAISLLMESENAKIDEINEVSEKSKLIPLPDHLDKLL